LSVAKKQVGYAKGHAKKKSQKCYQLAFGTLLFVTICCQNQPFCGTAPSTARSMIVGQVFLVVLTDTPGHPAEV
jgi:hypothetical protein